MGTRFEPPDRAEDVGGGHRKNEHLRGISWRSIGGKDAQGRRAALSQPSVLDTTPVRPYASRPVSTVQRWLELPRIGRLERGWSANLPESRITSFRSS
jgi:hypothetical protein